MLRARIAVLVSGGGTNLQALIDAQESGILKSGEICVVIASNPNAYAIEREENNAVFVELKVAPADMGKVIGHQGRIAKAIRTVVKAASSKNDKKVIVDILQ